MTAVSSEHVRAESQALHKGASSQPELLVVESKGVKISLPSLVHVFMHASAWHDTLWTIHLCGIIRSMP